MAYIRSDGTVAQGTRLDAQGCLRKASRAFWKLPQGWKAFVVAVAAFLCRRWLRPNPFAGGKIPASDVQPNEH